MPKPIDTESATPTPVATPGPALQAAAASTAGKQLTVETWAERKGLLPATRPLLNSAGKAVAQQANPLFWRFSAARSLSGWPIGAEVTEAEFDAAVELATQGVSR